MALYAIGDLHLSFSVNKPMDIFAGWVGYQEKLRENWISNIKMEDTTILLGDISWAMSLKEGLEDFQFIEQLPGKKYILKGNHDYWWTTKNKMENFFLENGLKSIHLLHNNSVVVDDKAICGSRGWLFEKGDQNDKKIITREAARLQLSINSIQDDTKHKIAFLHYPPIYANEISTEIIDVLLKNKITRCYYGHIHSKACNYALNGMYKGIDFRLVSSDFIGFNPILVK